MLESPYDSIQRYLFLSIQVFSIQWYLFLSIQVFIYSFSPCVWAVLRYSNKYKAAQVMDATCEISYKENWFHLGPCLALSRITSYYTVRTLRKPIERPMWWGTKACQQWHEWAWQWIFSSLPTTMGMKAELPAPGESWDDCRLGQQLDWRCMRDPK